MSSSFVVVVIVVAVVGAVAAATALGRRSPMTGSQPATAWRPTALAAGPPAGERPYAFPTAPAESPSAPSWVPPHRDGLPDTDDLVEVDLDPQPSRPLRAVVLLAMSVVLLGAAAAACLGAAALLIVRLANQALGL